MPKAKIPVTVEGSVLRQVVDARNRLANDVLVVPASTSLRPAPTHVRLKKAPAECGARHSARHRDRSLTDDV